MAEYRLYGLDGVNKVASGEWFDAEDDETAIEVAKTMMDGHDCELWKGKRSSRASRTRTSTDAVRLDQRSIFVDAAVPPRIVLRSSHNGTGVTKLITAVYK